ncbi:hypothetical protein SCLCIDRAFT_22275 [Scleroderma citrinum Foug A]|uniref:Uncharacterized protein n=1 Tax=Scleroderma citrinum Foug A TaxID=1036808 RepID=A0A0C2ZX74_9AGAM|nr:hypothetical protein SCLCIDRAFT_22275 [Scleroderma citrinum Foug A]
MTWNVLVAVKRIRLVQDRLRDKQGFGKTLTNKSSELPYNTFFLTYITLLQPIGRHVIYTPLDSIPQLYP